MRPLTKDVSEYDDFGTSPDNVPSIAIVDGYLVEQPEDFRERGNLLSISRRVRVSTFPYNPTPAEMASDFSVGSFDPGRRGSLWRYGTLSAPRVGTNPDAWALEPDEGYDPGTVSWLVSPAFDFTGLSASGYYLEWLLWLRADDKDALKIQVSIDSGVTWFDVVTTAAYNQLATGLLADLYGGGDDGWGGLVFGGPSPARIGVDIAPFEGLSDVRFRFGFASGGASMGQAGAVLDGVKVDVPIVPVLTSIVFVIQPLDTDANTTMSTIVVAALDQFGFQMPSLNAGSVDMAILNDPSSPGPATLSGTTTQPWVNGFATFNDLEIDERGLGFTLEATAGIHTAVSDPFNILQDFVQFNLVPTSVEANRDFSVVVAIYDELGVFDPTSTVPVTLAIEDDPTVGAATLSGTLTVNAVAGLATFTDLEIDLQGNGFTLRATSPGLHDDVSVPINVFFVTGASLTFGASPLAQIDLGGLTGAKSFAQPAQRRTTLVPFRFGVEVLSEQGLPFNAVKEFETVDPEAPFDYDATFGAGNVLDWWRVDLGRTDDGNTNVQTLVGQKAGITNFDLGASSRPAYIASSANLGGRPVMRWQDVDRNFQIHFPAPIVDTGVLLVVYYSPTFGTVGQTIVSGPLFGGFDGAYAFVSNTNLMIRDLNAGLSLTADAAANWAGAHALLAEFDETTKGSVRRDGGPDLRVSIQGGYCDVVNWKGLIVGPGIFNWKPEAGTEIAEIAVLTALPSLSAYDTWLAYVANRHSNISPTTCS